MKTFAGIALLSTLLAGCAHLEQAPLVYSSKTTLGVEVSTASVEAPGLVMNLGFRQIDAAYVPVAVGRPCNPGTGIPCEGPPYELAIVSGRSESGNNNGTDADAGARRQRFEMLTSQFADAAKAVSRADQRVLEAQGHEASFRQRLVDARSRQESYEVQQRSLPSLQTIVATGDPDAPETIEAAQTINTIQALQPEKGIGDLETAVSEANAAVQSAEAARLAAVDQLNRVTIELKSAQQAIEEVKRYDSYSVFGSFETGTRAGVGSASNGGNGDAGISLGKIFATGVASQNISDGLSRFYNSRALTACYDAVATIAARDAALAASTLRDCATLANREKR